MYVPVKAKLAISLTITILITTLIVGISIGWVDDLMQYFHPIISWGIVLGIALIPGFTNALIYSLLVLDKRPQFEIPDELPDVSILVAAYNEEETITRTCESILNQDFPGKIHTYIIDDGSTDNTVKNVNSWIATTEHDAERFCFHIVECAENGGKSTALNTGLLKVKTDYVVTIDADTMLHKEAVAHLVANIHLGPPNTAAVAGNILVRNGRENLMTGMQEWEYFLSISASKRSQSLLQGTLVAQGAISIYNTEIVRELGGWCPDCIGEDIVLTWGMHENGYRTSYAEKAIAFTDVPNSYRKFFKQRERWARGMIEAFKTYPRVIFRLKLTSPFIWVNVFLPFVDIIFLSAFVPGLLAALFFGWYEIASLMTLWVIPFIILLTAFMLFQHKRIFNGMGFKIRRNYLGLFFWAFTYLFWMTPATSYGYIREILGIGKKSWGTK